TIGGATTISGTHAVGNSPGIQTFVSDLTYTSTAVIDWELVADTEAGRRMNFDGIDVGGALTFDGATTFDFIFSGVDFTDAFWQADREWLVFSGATSVNGFSSGMFNASAANMASPTDGLFSLVQVGNDIFLDYAFSTTAVPEPTTTLMFGIGLGFIGLGRRRRRNSNSAE
ncbi:MAG: PEP-CTERM sorting domain-containing protein, partial [Mariniblastus sp.]